MKLFLSISFGLFILLSPLRAEEDVVTTQASGQSIEHWKQVWKSWVVASSSIEAEHFEYFARPSGTHPVLGDSEIHELIKRIRLLVESTVSPKLYDLEQLTEVTFPVDQHGKSEGRWWKTHKIQSMDKVRVDVTYKDPLGDDEIYDPRNYRTSQRTIARVDGQKVEHVHANRQISVFDSYSNTEISSFQTFVLAPVHLDKYSQWTSSNQPDGRIRFSGASPNQGTVELDVDGKTGFVYRLKHSGEPFSEEILQYMPVWHEHGIPVARLRTRVYWRNGVPDTIEASMVREIVLGAAIPDEQFVVAVPEGVLVVKFPAFGTHVPPSRGGVRPPMERVESPQPNAIELTRERGFSDGEYPHPNPPISNPHKWLFITNFIALTGLLTYLSLRHYRRTPSKPNV